MQLSPADLLARARATAAPGVGPWGTVSAPSSGARPLVTAATGPNLTFGVVMTYDAADGYVLAVSLNASAGALNNTYGPTDLTWKFSAGNWTQLTTVGQVPATLSPGLVYDAHDGYVLLYGGRLMDTGASVAPLTNQTWSYHAGVWSNLSSNSTAAPWAVDFANLVYDPEDEYVLLYDEIGITPTNPNGYFNTTWTYVSGTWTNITATAGTPPAMLGSMTYDVADHYVLYFGGYTWWNELTNATWTFHAGVWTNISGSVTNAPSPRMNFGIAYDTAGDYAVLYGGLDQLYVTNASEFSYQTWSYAGGTWTLLSSNGTIWSIQSMTYDVADNESVLLGSNSSLSGPPNVVTWTYSASGWAVASPLFVRTLWITDVGTAVTLSVRRPLNEGGLTYNYSGLPPGCTGANAPTLSCAPSEPGTYPVTTDITGAAGFSASATTTIVVHPTPSILGFSGTSIDWEVGIQGIVNVTASFGTTPLTYAYLGLPMGCASVDAPALHCVPATAGSYNTTVEVTDAIGVTAHASDALTVSPALSVAGLSPNLSALDVGQALSITTALSGGVGPFVYGYAGLPSGCASTDSSQLSCRPSENGSFSVRASTSDALGASAVGSAEFVVNPRPSVVSFVPSNETIPSGGSISLSATISGGTAPFEYLYTGLPAGCAPPDSAVVTCSKVAQGPYTVVITVRDATGATTTRTVAFQAVTPLNKPVQGDGQPMAPGFLVGFAIAAVAIGIVAVVGGRRLFLAREGEAIVRKLGSEVDEPFGTPSAPEQTISAKDGAGKEG